MGADTACPSRDVGLAKSRLQHIPIAAAINLVCIGVWLTGVRLYVVWNRHVLTTVATVMTEETSAAQDRVDEGDLKRISDEFGLGDVRNVAFLVDGLMNRN